MTYATQQNLYDRFGQPEIDQLADRDGNGVPDPGIIDSALTSSSELIDSYIGARYTLPLATAPAVLQRLNEDLARYELYSDAVPELVQTRRNSAIKLLTSIAAGTATLGVASDSAPPASDAPQTDPNAPPRTFTTPSLTDYTSDWPLY